MKKAMLILLCLIILLVTVSCDKDDKTYVEMSHNNNSADEIQSLQKISDNGSGQPENNESIQTKQYKYFYKAIDENPYDKWLKSELEKGERAEKTIYAEYLAFWKDELVFTIESGEAIFGDNEQYKQWKSDIQQWLVSSQEILKNEMDMMNCSLAQLEVIIPHCEMVRQKVIDTKKFLYYYQVYNTFISYADIEINWSYKDSEQDDKINVTFDTYDSIIATYKKLVEITPDIIDEKELYNENVSNLFYINEAQMDWFSRLTTSIAIFYPKDTEGLKNNGYDDFGYAVKDINGDNSDELILMLSDGTIIAIFTISNNVPVLLDTFRNRYFCSLNSNGDVFILGSNGAAQTVNRKYTIDSFTGSLLLICEYGTEESDTITGETNFYVDIGSEKNYLTESKYDEFCANNKVLTSSQLLEFLTYKRLF